MSNFRRMTKHPIRKDWQLANWHENLFGPRKYGVVFPSDLKRVGGGMPLDVIAFDPEKVPLEFKEK